MNKSYPSLIEIPLFERSGDTLQCALPWMNIKDLMYDFLRLQSLIISYWSTSCTANCSRTCAITVPGSTFTTSARIRQPWHPGISRFSDIAWPEAWSILHRKRYEYFRDSSQCEHWSLSRFNCLSLMIQLESVKSQLTLMLVGTADTLLMFIFHIYGRE